MINIKTPEEIEIMAEGGKILAKIIKELEKRVRPGVKTIELDRLAESLVFQYGGECSFKGHGGYPNCLCTSINEEIVHAIPSERVLKDGDILSLDLGIFYNGFHTDMAVTVPVGKINREAEELLEVTKNSLKIGIKEVNPGKTFGDISCAIQQYVEGRNFGVVRNLCGHGIGRNLHEDPEILNYGEAGEGEIIKEGMVFCLEPMVAMEDRRIKKSKDGFGYQTQDGSLSAHFEHAIAVTKTGTQVLTRI